tara:strand:+ start:246 stop:413 length:168 start_codon:yes stop_codon:yes gene_type:complete
MSNNDLPESWEEKGWGFPSILLSILVWVTVIVETFRDFPFALISALGTFVIFIAV